MSQSAQNADEPKTLALEHARDGYKNAQEVIRFLDTKTGVFLGLAVVGIGFVLQVVKEFVGLPEIYRAKFAVLFSQHDRWWWSMLIFCGISLLSGVVALYCGIRALMARAPRSDSKRVYTILFPHWPTKKADLDLAKAYLIQIQTGMALDRVAAEYESQIYNVGAILSEKMKWSRRSANFFLAQVALIVGSGCIFIGALAIQAGAPYQQGPVPALPSTNTALPQPAAGAPSTPKP